MKPGMLFLLVALYPVFSWGQGAYPEKITLTTDREIYLAGETIWYQAVVSETAYDGDSLLSKILYIELYDQHFNNIAQLKSRIQNGITAGNILIPSGTGTGNYLLRAYTQYSRNFSPYFQNTLLISIINPQIPLSENEVSLNDDLLVIPEGGSLIAGITSRVAVRMHPHSENLFREISVVNDSGEVIVPVIPSENGLALFEFNPEASRKYAVVLKKTSGNRITKQLNVKESGVMLKCQVSSGILNIKLLKSANTGVRNNYRLQVITQNSETIFEGEINAGEDLHIPLKEIEDEVVFCLIFNSTEIIDLRPVFIEKLETENIKVHSDKAVYLPRANVTLDFDFPAGFKGRAIVSAVYAKAGINDKNVIPWYVAYNPAFFSGALSRISSIDVSLQSQLDAIMILYSDLFRKNGMADYLTGKTAFEYLPDLRDAGINGTAIDKKSKLPANNVTVYCSVIDEGNQLHVYKTGDDGRFFFTLNHLEGIPHNVYISPANSDSVELLINSDFEIRYPESAGVIPFVIDSSYAVVLKRLYRNQQVNSVFPEFKPDTVENALYFPIKKPNPVNIIRLSDFIEMPVMEEVFSEIVPFVAVKIKGNRYYLQVYDERIKSTLDEPLVMLDGIPFFDMNQIMAIPTDLVEQVTVTNRTIQTGEYTINGMISVSTSSDNFAGVKLPAEARFIEFLGVKGECYPVFPDHSNDDDDRIPDFRTPLYWNPGVKGSPISFYASDETGEYEVTVRAFDGNKCYSGTTRFTVERQR